MARTGGECHGGDVGVWPVDMAGWLIDSEAEPHASPWSRPASITRLHHVASTAMDVSSPNTALQ